MPSTNLLISALKQDFPTVSFVQGGAFRWLPKERTIYYGDAKDTSSLLHEVAHADLGHDEYKLDIELIKMEREAWSHASAVLAPKYKIEIDQDQIDIMLDTYRNWLHNRSLCPSCEATGIQVGERQYTCLACTSSWRVNEARTCALRRYIAT